MIRIFSGFEPCVEDTVDHGIHLITQISRRTALPAVAGFVAVQIAAGNFNFAAVDHQPWKRRSAPTVPDVANRTRIPS